MRRHERDHEFTHHDNLSSLEIKGGRAARKSGQESKLHLEVESGCESLAPDALLVPDYLHEPVVNDLNGIRLVKLHGRHEDLPTLGLMLPEGVREVDECEAFVLLEDVPCEGDVRGAAAQPDLVSLVWQTTFHVLEHFDD